MIAFKYMMINETNQTQKATECMISLKEVLGYTNLKNRNCVHVYQEPQCEKGD